MGDTYTNRAMLFAPSIQLFDSGAPPAKVVSEHRWIHCANEGIYRGHHQGEFNLTRAVFEAFVRNFRDDPQYKAGALDVVIASGTDADPTPKTYTGGVRPVIQFDYEHASEMPSFEGTIPTSGAPACGWALDVCVRNGPDGKAQLWAFGKLGEQIRGQIGRDEYRSVSIAFTLEGVHWLTGKPIGPVLTSIAFTNHPFMRDLEPLAAANRGTSAPARGSVKPTADPNRDPSEAPDVGTSQPTGATMAEELRERICKSLGIRLLVDDAAVADAVNDAASSAGDLKSLLESLGVANPADAMKVIPELKSARDKLASLLGELDALLQQDTTADAAIAQADVGAAMKAGGFQGEGAKKALGAFREKCLSDELKKATAGLKPDEKPALSVMRASRAAGRAHFLKEYGIKEGAADDKLQLTRTLVAGKDGAQVQPPLAAEDRTDGTVIDLRGMTGANTTEKLCSYLTKHEAGFDKLSWERKIKRASELKRSAQLTQ